jgi:biopolymer transport protein ExbB/TolQ
VLERLWAFSRLGKFPQELLRRVENFLTTGKRDQAIRVLDEARSPFARVGKAGLLRHTSNPQELDDILTLAVDAEIANAERPLPVLGTIANIAPFIGLFGTVLGIMAAFRDYAQMKEVVGVTGVSGGIAEALIATAAGLAVAIIATITNNWCRSWVDGFRLQLERFSTEWSYMLQEGKQAEVPLEEPVV